MVLDLISAGNGKRDSVTHSFSLSTFQPYPSILIWLKYCWKGCRTSYCSYAWPIQPGPILQLCLARTAWSKSDWAVHSCNSWWSGPLWSDSVINGGSFWINVLPSWLRNADQWKPDFCEVTNEKLRNQELFGADQYLDVSSKVIELDRALHKF